MTARWMACAPCDVAWRGDDLPCFICGGSGTGSNGPILRGAANHYATSVEGDRDGASVLPQLRETDRPVRVPTESAVALHLVGSEARG